ncbi:MAG: DUF481 domain-containing protein, partial [Pseudomonadales bacterium]|nr:DUF481 domain-containing protein [Pseudomonadales bacterium]
AAVDVILLKNGDRISGDISRIWDGEVFIEPSYADEFAVDLSEVAGIDSDEVLDLSLDDRSELTGQLVLDEAGDQYLLASTTRTPLDLARIDIAEEPLVGRDFEANVDFATNVSSGNADTANLFGSSRVLARFGKHRNTARLAIDRAEDNGAPIKDQLDLSYRYAWLFADDWFVETGAGFRSDPVRDLDRRITVGAGIGHDLILQSWRRLQLAAGPTLVRERIGSREEDSVAFSWVHEYQQDFLSGNVEFFHRLQVLSYLSGRDNDVFDASTGMSIDVLDDFYVNLQLDVNYETNPAPGNVNEDITYRIGVGYEL